jgi:NTE family protein
MSFGIALGGGGARGLAHVGILEVLEEHNIRPKFVAGTSMGAVVGALYSLQGSTQGLRDRAKQMVASKEFKNLELDKFYSDADNIFERFRNELFEKFFLGSLLFKKSHSNYDATNKIFRDAFGDMSFGDCVIPFACNALDIQSGEEVVFEDGLLCEAVWASCAIPGIFPPFVKDKRIFVDGGVIDNIPVEPVLSIGAKSVLAVYLSKRPRYKGEPNTGFQINQRAYTFMKYHLDQRVLAEADIVIEPEIAGFHWADFSSIGTLIERGRTAALQNLGAIKSIDTRSYHLKKTLKQLFGVRSLL